MLDVCYFSALSILTEVTETEAIWFFFYPPIMQLIKDLVWHK